MKLVFDVVKNGKNVPSKRNFHFEEEGGSIGRTPDNDWVLTDPNSYISGIHAQILCKHGSYFIKDESTNGTFLKNPYKKLPKGHPVKINASDVFIIGDHELQARYTNNDYSDNDIISSFEETRPSPSSNDNIIPNDDFLFDSGSNGFTAVESQAPSDMDVLSILDATPSAAPMQENHTFENNSPFTDIVLEEENEVIQDVDISDFMASSVPEPVCEAVIETKEELFEEHIVVPTYTQPELTPAPAAKAPIHISEGLATSVAVLESKLGLSINALEQDERDILMAKIGDVVNSTLDALQNSLQLKDKTKQDLHLSTSHLDVDNNNPVRLGSAAAKLLQNSHEGSMLGMMEVPEAITKSFNEIDSHCIALHSSCKNIMKIATTKFSPKNLEYRFESSGALRGVLPRQQLLWKAYNEMFDNLNERPEEGVEMIREDFKKEYENISYSLKLRTSDTRNRV